MTEAVICCHVLGHGVYSDLTPLNEQFSSLFNDVGHGGIFFNPQQIIGGKPVSYF